MATTNVLWPLQSLGMKIENVYRKHQWAKPEEGLHPDIIFDKQASTDSAHNMWWAYVQPRDYPSVTGYGKTLQEALQSLHDQLQLGPQNWMAGSAAQQKTKTTASKMKNHNSKTAAKSGVPVPASVQSLNSGSGSHTRISAAPPTVQAHDLRSVIQPVSTSTTKQIPNQKEKLSIQKVSQRDAKLTFGSLNTTAAHPTFQVPTLGSVKSTVPNVAKLMEKFTVERRAQSGVGNTPGTPRMPELPDRPVITVPPFASLTPNPIASFSKTVVSQEKRAGSQHQQVKSKKINEQLSFGDPQEQYQNKAGSLKTFEYQDPKTNIDNSKSHDMVPRTYPFRSTVPSMSRIFASPKTKLQTMGPAHGFGVSGSASAVESFLSYHLKKGNASSSQEHQTQNDAGCLPAAGVSTLISQSEHKKRKHDGPSYGGPSLDTEQQLQKKIKIEEQTQMIKVEEELPKKIKLEYPSQIPLYRTDGNEVRGLPPFPSPSKDFFPQQSGQQHVEKRIQPPRKCKKEDS